MKKTITEATLRKLISEKITEVLLKEENQCADTYGQKEAMKNAADSAGLRVVDKMSIISDIVSQLSEETNGEYSSQLGKLIQCVAYYVYDSEGSGVNDDIDVHREKIDNLFKQFISSLSKELSLINELDEQEEAHTEYSQDNDKLRSAWDNAWNKGDTSMPGVRPAGI